MEVRDFFKQAFSVGELRSLPKSLRLTAHDVVSTKSPSYRKMNLDANRLTEEELLRRMVEEPRLIRRPLIVIGSKPIVGFDREALSRRLK